MSCAWASPSLLIGLGAVAVVGLIAARLHRRTGLGLGLRLAVLSTLILALAQPSVEWLGSTPTVVYLVDRSASVGTDALTTALSEIDDERGDRSGLVSFGDGVQVLGRPGHDWSIPEELRADGARTDLDEGLQTAMGLIPQGAPGRIVVFSDGQWDLPAEAVQSAANARGLEVEVRAMQAQIVQPRLGALDLDQATVAPGATLSGSLVVHGGAAGFNGTIPLEIAGAEVGTVPVTIEPAASDTIAFEVSIPVGLTPDQAALRVVLGDAGLSRAFGLRQPPRVLVVGDAQRDTGQLTALLQAEQFEVRAVSASDAAPLLDGVDLVILVDTPTRKGTGRPALSTAFVDALEPFVQAGGGLIVVGGEHAYELGGWHESGLGGLLPVRIDPDGALKDDAVSLVIVLDKSGSMARAAGTLGGAKAMMGSITARFHGGRPEGSKIRLASEGAIAALERLRDVDQFGVLAVDSEAHWIVPLGAATGRSDKVRRISSISAGGGGMFVVTGMQAARAAILEADTPLRHVILFADTGDAGEKEAVAPAGGGAPESAFGIAAGLAKSDVTVSVIGIGAADARDTPFLKKLARIGRGRFQQTQKPTDIPALFSRETEELLGAGLQEGGTVQAQRERWHPMLEGLDFSDAPALLGHNITHRRPQSRVLLTSDTDAPLLSIWRIGLGEVVAVSTDASSRWAANWVDWHGFSRLWTQMARHMVPQQATEDLSIEVSTQGADMVVIVERRGADGLSLSTQGLQVHAVGDERQPIQMALVEPGRWRGAWRPTPGTFHQIDVRNRDGQRLGGSGVSVPTSQELRHQGIDADKLARLARPAGEAAGLKRTEALRNWLLLLAALLLVGDAFARRAQSEQRQMVGSTDAGMGRGARMPVGMQR